MKTIVFLGGGRITSALVAGLRLARSQARIVVHDRHSNKMRSLRRFYGVIAEKDLDRAVQRADMLVIAVRPDAVRSLLSQVRPPRAITAISLAAGVPLRDLRAACGTPVRWARAMPSPVCRYGRGLTAVTFERRMSASARREVVNLFAQTGAVLEIPERQFDAFTVTYSSSHGYHALQTMAEAAQKLGLNRKTALTAATHALADGIACWRDSKESLHALLHEAATPGGIAATVMQAMNATGYRKAVEKGLRAGLARAKKNASRQAASRPISRTMRTPR